MFRAALTLLALCGALFSQERSFEVASIKPSTPQSVRGTEGGPDTKDPTRYKFGQVTVIELIANAYNVRFFQISTKTALTDARYDFDARIPAGAAQDDFPVMLRAFLAERFHLQTHTESRDFPAYELTVAKSGLKTGEDQPRFDPKNFPVMPPGHPRLSSSQSNGGDGSIVRLRAQQQTVSALAGFITLPGDAPIIDHTGLTGKYDFFLEYTYEFHTAAAAAGPQPGVYPDIFHALEQQLGLKLSAKKLPFEVIVIDAIDKSPTAN
jgi:uncharacterized protein (TIGR03435 family)